MEPSFPARLASGLAYLIVFAAIVLTVLLWPDRAQIYLAIAAAAVLLALIGLSFRSSSRFALVHAVHGLTLLPIVVLWELLLHAVPVRNLWVSMDLPVLSAFLLFFCAKNAMQGYYMDWPVLTWLRRRLDPVRTA